MRSPVRSTPCCRAATVVIDDGEYLGPDGSRPLPAARPVAVPADLDARQEATDGIRRRAAIRPAGVRAWSSSRSRPRTRGFGYVWTFDSHRALAGAVRHLQPDPGADPQRVIVGPMVTNPATRDWTVTASLFATLNEMFGNRTICGIGRGDSAVRVLTGAPATLATLRDAIARHPRAGQRPARSTYDGRTLRIPWVADSAARRSGSPPTARKALALAGEVGDGFILQLADPDIARVDHQAAVRDAAADGRARPCLGQDLRRRARLRRRRTCAHMRDSAAGSAAWSATTSPTSSPATARRRPGAAGADRLHRGAAGLRLQPARAGRTTPHADFVPDEIVDRFCLLGTAERARRAAAELRALGVDQFAVYLQHDGKEQTLAAYGSEVIPALNPAGLAVWSG